jgi:hypothetical protein
MEPYVLGREEGEPIWMVDALDTIKAAAERTGGGVSVVEFLDFDGSLLVDHHRRHRARQEWMHEVCARPRVAGARRHGDSR